MLDAAASEPVLKVEDLTVRFVRRNTDVAAVNGCSFALKAGETPTEELRSALVKHVRAEIGPFAAPDAIQWAPGLPKTRSGKIMRRILRKVAENDMGNLGDTSTLADPSVVDDLVRNRVG